MKWKFYSATATIRGRDFQTIGPGLWLSIVIGLLIPLGWPSIFFYVPLPLSTMQFALLLVTLWSLQVFEFVVVWYYCGSKRMPFFYGLGLIASESSVFGFPGIFLYALRMQWIFMRSLAYTCIGVVKGREYVQDKYDDLIKGALIRMVR